MIVPGVYPGKDTIGGLNPPFDPHSWDRNLCAPQ